MSPTAEKFGFSSQGDQGRPKAGGFGCALECTTCCFQPLSGKGVQFASLSASKEGSGTFLSCALGCCWL